jgi:hypothetical protein
MSGKNKSATEPKGGDRKQVGEETQPPGDKPKEAKGTAKADEQHGKSAAREKDEHEGKSAERGMKDQSGDLSDQRDRDAAESEREHREKSAEERGREDRNGKSAESRDDRDHNAQDHKCVQFEPRDKEKGQVVL